MPLKQKIGKCNAIGMIFLLLGSGCANSPVDSFCLWSNPIFITEEERETLLSEETLRQIDNFNQEYLEQCNNQISVL